MEPRATTAPLKVAWFTYFPIEWLEDLPAELSQLPRMHPATWQRVLLAELQQDASLDLHIVVLRKHFPRTLRFQRGNTTFHCLKVPGGWRALSLFWVDTWYVARALKEIRPDLVHAWGTENGAALIAARLRYPKLVTMQGIMGWMRDLGVANSYQRFAARLEPGSLRRSDHVTTESNFAVGYLHERYPNLRLRQIEHAPAWAFQRLIRQPQRAPLRIVSIGTLGPAKGTDVLLQALEPLCEKLDFEVVLIGGAPPGVKETLQAQTSPTLWERLRFRNHLTSEEVAAELCRASLMVYPTRADNSPNSVKEAVVAGLPVVASAIGGIVDYVKPGANGFLFTSGDVQGCRQGILQALEHPFMGRGLIEPEVLAEAREALSPATMARKFRQAYADVAAGLGGRS